jgi:hypothetical protein
MTNHPFLKVGRHTCVQALSQNKGQDKRTHVATCLAAPKPASLLREGSGVAMSPNALNIASPSKKSLGLPSVLRLRHCHASLDTRPPPLRLGGLQR